MNFSKDPFNTFRHGRKVFDCDDNGRVIINIINLPEMLSTPEAFDGNPCQLRSLQYPDSLITYLGPFWDDVVCAFYRKSTDGGYSRSYLER
jgi:hypothetical protein